MYLDFFGLSEAPFSITPDPTFVYLSPRHRDALAHLLYGVGQGGSGGFVQLTGEVGTGKTTLCRCLLEQVPEDTKIALVLNPLMTPPELLAAICEELGISTARVDGSSKKLVDRLNKYLLEAHQRGERVVVVIDEAQNLSPESLEQVRLLTNLETSKQKLLQIVLLGQPELRELLQRRSLRQLAQRITARYHLTPLDSSDTAAYVAHRIEVAGGMRNPFRKSALRALFQRSHGIPRLINIIADRAMVAAFASEKLEIGAQLVHAAADEVQLGEPGARRQRWPWAVAAVGGLVLAASAWWMLDGSPQTSEERGREAVAAGANAVPQTTAAPDEVLVEAPAQLPELIDSNWLLIQDQAAWRGLASLWGDPGDTPHIESACRSGDVSSGWACLRENGSYARIMQLGLPVVLQLQNGGGSLLLLQGLDEDSVLVGAPGTSQTHDRSLVEERWFGAYYVAWPQASNWPREIDRGQTGPAVATVIELAANAERGYHGPPEFGPEFERWLMGFQQRNGLDADGIVGPRTLLYLMRTSISRPKLRSNW